MNNKIIKLLPLCLSFSFLLSSCANGTKATKVSLVNEDVKSYLNGTKEIKEFIEVKADSQNIQSFDISNTSGTYKIKLSLNKNLDNAIETTIEGTQFKVTNLLANTQYYYQAYAEDDSPVGKLTSFITENDPRIVNIDGLCNVRDIGGWSYGKNKYIKQGLVYRGSEGDQHYSISENGLNVFKNELKIKYDLDFRTNGESNYAEVSAFDSEMKYSRIALSAYQSCTVDSQLSMYKQALQIFADKDNYPIYMHCYQGADRTGTIAYILEALMGVSEEDMKKDYELTTFSGTTKDTYRDTVNDTSHNYKYIGKNISILYKADTLQESVEKYMIEGLGMSQEEVNSIKSILAGETEIATCAIAEFVR